MIFKFLTYIIFIPLLFTGAAFAQNVNTISLATAEWEDYTNADGTGLYFEIFREVFKRHNIEVKYQVVPYERSVKMVEDKTVDAWVASYVDEEDFARYPKWHFDADVVVALFKKDKFPKWRGERSLVGKNVSWIRGYSYDDYLEIRMNKHEVSKRINALKMLQRGRIDVFLDAFADITEDERITVNELGMHFKDGYNEFQFSVEEILELKLYLAFADTDRARELMRMWDKTFPVLLKNGTIKALFDKNEIEDFPFETE